MRHRLAKHEKHRSAFAHGGKCLDFVCLTKYWLADKFGYIYTVREQESMAALIAKIGTIFVPRTLPHRRILFQRSLQRPQACSLLDAVYGRDRTGTFITIWPGPHRDRADTLIYGRDRTEMLFTMAGTAPGRSLLWPGPHRDTHYYGRDRTGTALTHSLLWPGPH